MSVQNFNDLCASIRDLARRAEGICGAGELQAKLEELAAANPARVLSLFRIEAGPDYIWVAASDIRKAFDVADKEWLDGCADYEYIGIANMNHVLDAHVSQAEPFTVVDRSDQTVNVSEACYEPGARLLAVTDIPKED